MSNYSNIPLSQTTIPTSHSDVLPQKKELKKAASLWGAFSLLCVLESAIILRDNAFELIESEFLTIHSKAKSTVPKQTPHTEEREGGSNSPQRD